MDLPQSRRRGRGPYREWPRWAGRYRRNAAVRRPKPRAGPARYRREAALRRIAHSTYAPNGMSGTVIEPLRASLRLDDESSRLANAMQER